MFSIYDTLNSISLLFNISVNGKSSLLPGLTPHSSTSVSRDAVSRLHDTTSQSDTLDSEGDDDNDVMPSDRSPRVSVPDIYRH